MEDEWTVDANEALTISLVEPSQEGNSLNKIASFHPKFTYPLFGDEERIFGHKDLKVRLQYDASDLRPNLSISSSKKFASVGDIEATDVSSIMKEHLPGVAFQKSQDFQQAIRSLPDSWTPPGRLIKTLDKGDDVYEVWHGNLADLAVRQLVKRIQVVSLLFIEGGSYIGVDTDGKDEPESSLARWSIYFLYRKNPNPDGNSKRKYIFQGYSTVYHFWMFQQPSPPTTPGAEATSLPSIDSWQSSKDFDLTSLPHRARISQFVILPPFQKKGAGAFLYDTIFGRQISDPSIQEVTIEDPNEAFDILRDICDLKYLRKSEPDFANLKVNPKVPVPEKGGVIHNNTAVSLTWQASPAGDRIVDIDTLEKLRVKHKIAPRQFSRLVEIHLMSQLPTSVRPQVESPESKKRGASKEDRHVYTLWRLLLKQRLYRRNATLLGEFEITERILKLNETVENVEWEYANILEHLAPKPATSNGKRKLDEVDVETSSSGKKARVEDA